MSTKTLLATASAITLALSATAFTATPAQAEDCLLDTNNDGNADNNYSNNTNDGNANNNESNNTNVGNADTNGSDDNNYRGLI